MLGKLEKIMLGKKVLNHVYWHYTLTLEQIDTVQKKVEIAEKLADLTAGEDYNIVKFNQNGDVLSLLFYPDFFDAPFPALAKSWRIDLVNAYVEKRNYTNSHNPPILHRKEQFISATHPRQPEFIALTKTAEQLGLFDNTLRIGFKNAWEALISERGFQLIGNDFVPLANVESIDNPTETTNEDSVIARHLTALSRTNLSAPIQSLARYGFLNGENTLFDYGCGKGDDLRNLRDNAISANGWDPYYLPESEKIASDLVNLGFVINVIEDFQERETALKTAYSLTNKLLVVSAMLLNQNAFNGEKLADGVRTQRNTFQKYYSQSELKEFIENTLENSACAVAPGIFFVFKDANTEQDFLLNRQRRRSNVLCVSRNLTVAKSKKSIEELPQFDMTHENRIDDLLTYLALQFFAKRQPSQNLNNDLQRDIKALFGDYSNAQHIAQEMLFKIGDVEAISAACKNVSEEGAGYLDAENALYVCGELVETLPALLRIYIGCGAMLYGDISQTDLIKIHTQSGKLTLLKYHDFKNSPLPELVERVKINLRNQDFQLFQYGEEYPSNYLYLKSRYINEEFPNYAEQLAFDEKLESLNLFDFSGYGEKPDDFVQKLKSARLEINGFELQWLQTIPNLDDFCGTYLTYRQLIECGETQQWTKLPNLPKQPDSYTALYELAKNVLDPIIEYFGMIKLTYGFCSHELSQHISLRIAPKLDQHSAHELNSKKNLICPRLGAAVDFLVEDENMSEVTDWIIENTVYDRMYFYGENRPIHISYSPDPKCECVEMIENKAGRCVPKTRKRRKN